MLEIALAIAPVFLLILVGYALAAGEMFSQMFWRGAERLTYFVLFPALLFTTLAGAQVAVRQVLPMAGAMAAAIMTVVLLLLILRPTLLRRATSSPASCRARSASTPTSGWRSSRRSTARPGSPSRRRPSR